MLNIKSKQTYWFDWHYGILIALCKVVEGLITLLTISFITIPITAWVVRMYKKKVARRQIKEFKQSDIRIKRFQEGLFKGSVRGLVEAVERYRAKPQPESKFEFRRNPKFCINRGCKNWLLTDATGCKVVSEAKISACIDFVDYDDVKN